MIYLFDDFTLDLRRFELSSRGELIQLEPQVFDVLAYLVKHHDRLVTKDELLEAVWGDKFVSEAALNSRVMSARKAVGDSGKEQRLIRTVHGRGFRFAGDVRERSDADSTLVAEAEREASPRQTKAAPVAVASERPLDREQEVARLHDLLARADAGEQQTLFVVGDPGIGKTTLVEAFLIEATERPGVVVARGQSVQQRGAGEAYMPVFEALGDLCRGPGWDAVVAFLSRHAPTWVAQMPWLLEPADYEALQQRVVGATRERMLREMVEALRALTSARTLVMVLEDLHWCDHSTIDLIASLARTKASRLMIIATYRPADAQSSGHPVHALAQELSLRGEAQQLMVGPLSAPAVEALLRKTFAGSEPPEGLAQLLWERAAGNPLYVSAIVDSWVAEGSLSASNGNLVTTIPAEELLRRVPKTLQQLVEQRFGQLDPDHQRLLEAASPAGLQFTAAEAGAASGFPLEDADTLLAALARHGQFVESAGEEAWQDGTISGRYRFLHEFYQEVLYQRLPAARRVQFHRAIGDRLECGFGSGAADIAPRLAVHFRNGRDDERARRYLQISADVALRRAGHEEAIRHLRPAIELLERVPEGPQRSHEEVLLLLKLAATLVATRGWAEPEVESTYRRAHELSAQTGDPDLAAQATFALGGFYEIRGDYERAGELMNQRLELQSDAEAEGRVDSYELLACSEFHQGMFESSLRYADRGVGLYRPQHHNSMAVYGDHPGVACHDWAALSLWFLGYPDQALHRAREAMTLAEDPYNFYSLATARIQFAVVHQLRREAAQCEQWADATVSLSTRYGYPYRTAMGMIVGGWARAAQGRTDEGVARANEGLEVALATGAEMDHAYFLGLLAEAYLFSGNSDKALETIREALAWIPTGRTFFYEAELHRMRGRAVLDSSDDAALASKAYWRAFEVAQAQNARSLQLRAAMALMGLATETDQAGRALAELKRLYEEFEDGLETPDLTEARALLDARGQPA